MEFCYKLFDLSGECNSTLADLWKFIDQETRTGAHFNVGSGHNRWKCLSVDAPSRETLSLSVFLPKSRQRMSRRHAVTSRDITWHQVSWQNGSVQYLHRSHHKNKSESGDFHLWPATLIFKLVWDIVIVKCPTKFWVRTSNSSVGRALTDKHTHTDARDRLYTLDRWCGREWKNIKQG